MTTYPITHAVVREVPPPRPVAGVVGHYHDLTPQPEPKAVIERVADEDEDDDGAPTTKVVKRGRRPAAPKANEGAEVK